MISADSRRGQITNARQEGECLEPARIGWSDQARASESDPAITTMRTMPSSGITCVGRVAQCARYASVIARIALLFPTQAMLIEFSAVHRAVSGFVVPYHSGGCP